MADAYLALDYRPYLAGPEAALNLGDGSGSFSLSAPVATSVVQALGRPEVQRQAVKLDNSASISTIFDGDIADRLEALLGSDTQWTVFNINTKSGFVRGGPVDVSGLDTEMPFDDFIDATGTLDGTDKWFSGRAVAFAGSSSPQTITVPSALTTVNVAYVMLTVADPDATLSFGGETPSAAIHLHKFESNVPAELSLTIAANTTMEGYYMAGKYITLE